MAIVEKHLSKSGATILIDDSAYREKTPEELEAVKKNLDKVIGQCIMAEAKNGTLKIRA